MSHPKRGQSTSSPDGDWPPPVGTFSPHYLLDSLHDHLHVCGTEELWALAASADRIAQRARLVARARNDQLHFPEPT
jgi:hypothetical protein